MKKNIIIIVLISLFLLVGCDIKKEAITSTDFNKVMSEKNFKVTNLSKDFESTSELKEVFIAQSPKLDYQIEYYLLDSKESTAKFYNTNMEKLKNSAKGYSNVEMNGLNYSRYSQTTSSKYQVISCVELTCIFLNVNKDKKDEIKEILEVFNY